MSAARVAVVVAVWDDYVELLGNCLDSVRSQSGVNVELVVVDNASVRPVPEPAGGVVCVRTERRLSAGAARNFGLQHVSAPMVLFLDADDTLQPGALMRLTDMLSRDPDAIAAVGKHLLWSPATGRELVVARSPRPAVYRIAHRPRLLAMLTLRYDCYPFVGCAVVRTAAVRDAGGFGDASLAEDWVLRSALAFRGRVIFTRTPVVRVRVRAGTLWHREHTRSELQAMYGAFREHRRADPRLPWWGRVALRPIARAHARDVARLTAGGTFRPAEEVLGGPRRADSFEGAAS